VPFVRFARDKRGYEYVYLVEASTRNRQMPPHVLYWYRTPPGVRVGREPFDAEVRQALEARYRDITFDWKAITSAQPPNPQVETWRERRRAKRDARRQQGAPPPGSAPSGEPSPDMESVDDEPLEPSNLEEAETLVSGPMDAAQGGDADPAMLEEADEPGDHGTPDDTDGPGQE
jgi:hypothetical protein